MRMMRRSGIIVDNGPSPLETLFADMNAIASISDFNSSKTYLSLSYNSRYNSTVYVFCDVGGTLDVCKIVNATLTRLNGVGSGTDLYVSSSGYTRYLETDTEYYGGTIAVVTFPNHTESQVDELLGNANFALENSHSAFYVRTCSAVLERTRSVLYIAAVGHDPNYENTCYFSVSNGLTPTTPIFSGRGNDTNEAYLFASENTDEYYAAHYGETDTEYVAAIYSVTIL